MTSFIQENSTIFLIIGALCMLGVIIGFNLLLGSYRKPVTPRIFLWFVATLFLAVVGTTILMSI